jgi:hemerythrin-like domain-containing protein
MKSSPKPIKRSPELAPLSREHHEGLLFVWKIRQGLKNATDITILNAYVRWFWLEVLQHHLTKEEKTFVPMLDNDPQLIRMLDEHIAIRAFLEREETFDQDALLELASLIEKHIRFEERELFPHLERTLSSEQLLQANTQIATSPVCRQWEEAFWISKVLESPPGYNLEVE